MLPWEETKVATDRSTPVRLLCGTVVVLAGGAALAFYIWHSKSVDSLAVVLVLITLAPLAAPMLDNISIGNTKLQFRVKKNEDDIENLKFIMRHFLTFDELSVLFRLSKNVRISINSSHWTYEYDKTRILKLREQGFVTTPAGMGFSAIERKREEQDARDHFQVTDHGREFLKRRERAVGLVDLPNA
jgi:hypothetical protein